MEFDVRLASASIGAWLNDERHDNSRDDSLRRSNDSNRISAFSTTTDEDDLPGPYVIEVPDSTWTELADVLFVFVGEQQEFVQMVVGRGVR